MNPALQLLAPLLVLLPAGGPVKNPPGDGESAARYAASVGPTAGTPRSMRTSPGVEPAGQVRIEEHITIRIVPRGAWRDTALLLQAPATPRRVSQRRIGRCLAVAGIAGVQPNQGGELILYMRDRRVVSGMLERACRARDFYSGFYLARSGDGKLCVDRDTLLSRNGANCRLKQIRQLVLDD